MSSDYSLVVATSKATELTTLVASKLGLTPVNESPESVLTNDHWWVPVSLEPAKEFSYYSSLVDSDPLTLVIFVWQGKDFDYYEP